MSPSRYFCTATLLVSALIGTKCRRVVAFSLTSTHCPLFFRGRVGSTIARCPAQLASVTADTDTEYTSNIPNVAPGENKIEKALFGMGCFWAPQEEFNKLMGVESVTTGYAPLKLATADNDKTNDKHGPASYISVCNGDGRIESVLVEYDSSLISYEQLLETFWTHHDASAISGPKSQYQSVIWPLTESQQQIAVQDVDKAIEVYEREGMSPPLTQVMDVVNEEWLLGENDNDAPGFTEAEAIHQQFWTKLRLKLVILAISSLSASVDIPFVNDVLPNLTRAIVAVWILLEAAELVGRATDSFGKTIS